MISVWKPGAPRKKVLEQRLGQRFAQTIVKGVAIAWPCMRQSMSERSLRATKQGCAISAEMAELGTKR
jgi:hypothetical protein